MICVDCLPLEGEGPVHRIEVRDARKAARLMIARIGEGVRVRLVARPRVGTVRLDIRPEGCEGPEHRVEMIGSRKVRMTVADAERHQKVAVVTEGEDLAVEVSGWSWKEPSVMGGW